MVTHAPTHPLAELYETDETAWLDATARLLAEGRLAEVDTANLIEYLTSMAKRDRRELFSRLVVLLVHMLKWSFQPEKRTTSWATTIIVQQAEVEFDIQSGTLQNYAEEVLPTAFAKARKLAVVETGLNESTFPTDCPWTVDEAVAFVPE